MEASFSTKVTYAEMADRVGLREELALKDIQTFELHRSRISTKLFKSIIMDMDVYRERYIFVGKREGTKKLRLDGWDQALISADGALETFR